MSFRQYAELESQIVARSAAELTWLYPAAPSCLDILPTEAYACGKEPPRSRKSMRPAPVYVGTFADGAEVRLSFWQEIDKPLDFARGRRLAMLAGLRRVPEFCQAWEWRDDALRPAYCVPLSAGRVECAGDTMPDPAFAPAVEEVRRIPRATYPKMTLKPGLGAPLSTAREYLQVELDRVSDLASGGETAEHLAAALAFLDSAIKLAPAGAP